MNTVAQKPWYIGAEWSPDGFGPDKFSCWGLLAVVQAEQFGQKVPDVPLGDVEACKALYKRSMENNEWRIVKTPVHGDAVLLRGGDHPHVGLWLENDGGGVLHSLEGHGVVFTRKSMLRNIGMNRLTFYRQS